MVRTRVGYAGGTTPHPTYHDLGDHTETIQIDFDPAKLSYAKLLEVFWSAHDPCEKSWSRQYKAVVFYHDEEQQRVAAETRDRVASPTGKVFTELLPYVGFTVAEDYHQKYRLRSTHELIKEFSAFYPNARAFMNSTAAARVNGYLAGYGKAADVERELADLGLSLEGGRAVLARLRGR